VVDTVTVSQALSLLTSRYGAGDYLLQPPVRPLAQARGDGWG